MSYLYQNNISPMAPQSAPIPYKPVTFERMVNIVGAAYNLSSIENMNTLPQPRGGEQQIFFVNNDEKIYTRQFDNSLGIIGYKQEYVQRIENELEEAQKQLHEIFESVTQEETNQKTDMEVRIENLEAQLKSLMEQGGNVNDPSRTSKAMAAISELAKAE